VLGLLAASSSDRVDTIALGDPNGDGSIPVRTLALTAHDPIVINGNAGFTNESGVVWGSGTESDPFIMEDWDINASSTHGIHVKDSDVYFVIRGCSVFNTGQFTKLIYLENCNNGTLSDNNCSNSGGQGVGIDLLYSCNNTLVNNTCSSNVYGVWLIYSIGNTLVNNICSNNSGGIVVDYGSNSNTLVNNTCSNSSLWGILLDHATSNMLINNNCSNCDSGIEVYCSSSNMLINNCCSNNWRGTYLDTSSSNTLVGNNCSNGTYGILLGASNGNSLINNTCISNNRVGIEILGSSEAMCIGNSIAFNLIRNNSGRGIEIGGLSNDNRIWNNTFADNNGATDTYDAAHIQAIDDGLGNWWNSTDGYGNYWSDWTTPDAIPPWGVVDHPYLLDGSAGAEDYYPLTTTPSEPIPEFGMMPFVVMVLLATTVLTMRAWRRKAQ
jgi:parallel beta-helix repeat protein